MRKNLSKHGKTGGLMGFERLIQGVHVCFRIFGGEGNADDTGGGALVKTQQNFLPSALVINGQVRQKHSASLPNVR